MKTRYLILILVGMPLIIMIGINEMVRFQSNNHLPSSTFKINSSTPDKNKCTWTCHNNTSYCKTHHVKLLNNHFNYTDKLYFGIINTLQSSGHYGLANVLILALLIPGLINFFIIKSVQIQNKIHKLQSKKWAPSHNL